jgi:hypothetical protein
MDFKSLLNKLDSMDAPVATPAAPTIPAAVQLNEDAQLRVLSGATTYVAEAKKKADEDKKKDEKVKEAAEKTATTWTDMSGKKHPATKVKGDKYTGKEAEKEDKKSKKDESIDLEAFDSKFQKMVEAKKKASKKMEEGAKPDFLDLDKDGNKKEPMKSAAKSKGGDKKDSGKKGMSAAQEKYFGKKESVEEASEKTATTWTDMKGKKHPATKVKGDKYTGKEAEKDSKSKKESVARRAKVVAESVEQTLSFREMMKLVVESGGQQQIDPLDAALFNWAQRVAKAKFAEGTKAEVYAGLIYERNGGRFEMYDVLSEAQK